MGRLRSILAVLSGLSAGLAMSAQELPVYSVTCPEASGLGEYGEIPVSHFTGVPKISVPLYEIKYGDYTIPVSADYHLSSVRPNTPPGNLGIGWTLRAGGVISRTVRGVYDEKKAVTGSGNGFYWNTADLKKVTEDGYGSFAEQTRDFLQSDTAEGWHELSADEFSFSFLDYSGNFYINEDGGWSVVSDCDIRVEFDPETGFAGIGDLESRIPDISRWAGRDGNTKFFKEFTLVTPDGCRYVFGGIDATDFSIPYYSRATEDIIATSWHLSRIVTPEGYTVSFSYLSTGSRRPVMVDIRYVPGFRNVQQSVSGSGTALADACYNTGRKGFTGFLLYGCDLEKISTPDETVSMYYYADLQYETAYSKHAGEALYWSDGEKRQGAYTPAWADPSLQFLQLINARAGASDSQTRANIASSLRCNVLHRMAIDCSGPDGHDQSVYFEQGGPGRRKLKRVVWRAGIPPIVNRPAIGGGVAYPRYEIPENDSGVDMPEYRFAYNPGTFPAGYVFPQTDQWGYYTGKSNSPADVFDIGHPTFDSNPSATGYETLTEIQYPAGGSSVFEYEGNDYSRKVAAVGGNPVSSAGTSGGLRIRSITARTREGEIAGITRYHYKESLTSPESSGIAAPGSPFSMTYNASDSQEPAVQYVLHLVSGSGFAPPVTNLNTPYVGYSSVIEERLDAAGESAGYTKYVYSNYGPDIYGDCHNDEPAQYAFNCFAAAGVPYSSRSTERGRLLSRQFYSRDGRLVRREDTRYAKVCNDSLLTADQRLINFSMQNRYATANVGWLTWTYTYSYLPVSTQVYQYDGPVPYSGKQTTGYNEQRLPAFRETFVGTGATGGNDGGAEDIRRESFTYPSDDAGYSWMADAHILSPVISYKVSRGGSWSRQDCVYANCGQGAGDVLPYLQKVSRSANEHPEPWPVYEALSVERHGKPTEIWQDGRNSVLRWDSTGQVLMMRIDNMTQAKFDSLAAASPLQQLRTDVVVPVSREQLSRHAALPSTCSYNGNLQPVRTTTPDDVTSNYEYDVLRRLKRVYYVKAPGHHDKTVSTYAYRYAGASAPSASPSASAAEDAPDTAAGRNSITAFASLDGSQTNGMRETVFCDGFGRQCTYSRFNASPSGKTLTSLQEYDGWGRKGRTWLAGCIPAADGHVKMHTVKDHIIETYGDAAPYSCDVYEASPLGRVVESYGPGEDWQDNGRAVRTSYLVNDPSDSLLDCRMFRPGEPGTAGSYPAGSLSVVRTEDEDGMTALTFTDRLGHRVLTRQVGKDGHHDTYYIYDAMERLAAVLQPELAAALVTGCDIPEAGLDKYAFLYRYDGRGRLCGKKLPGAAWVYYVNDAANRIVYEQDGENRLKGKSVCHLYDNNGRECVRLLCSKNIAPGEELGKVLSVKYAGADGAFMGYDLCEKDSVLTHDSCEILLANYYDNYAFADDFRTGLPSMKPTLNPSEHQALQDVHASSSVQNPETDRINRYPIGQQTGCYSMLFNEGRFTSGGVWTGIIYDTRGRNVHNETSYPSGECQTEDVAYNFTGNPISRHIEHYSAENSGGSPAADSDILTEHITYTYDNWLRLLTGHHSLNGKSPVLLFSNAYDDVGRLSKVQRGSSSTLTETMEYNIRSWLLASSSELFSQKLFYNIPRAGTSAPCYNGFVSSFEWKSGGDVFTRAYDYGYDAFGRLSTAAYSSADDAITYDDYSTAYGYDAQSNLTEITRCCTDSRRPAYLDRLRLAYDGNQLRNVTDAAAASGPDSTGFNDGADELMEYGYNLNGNLTKDLNRSIDKITYDIANRPAAIRSDGAQISFDYLAYGPKLGQTIATAKDTVAATYQGGLVRQNGKVKYLLTDGGYIDFSSNNPVYMFYLKDYLGNNRVAASSSGNVAQVNNYYPYGVSFPTDRQSSPLEPGFPGVPSLPEQGTEDDSGLQTASAKEKPDAGSEDSGRLSLKDTLTQGGATGDGPTIGGGATAPADSLQASLTDRNQPWRFSGNELLEGGPVRLYDFIARTCDQALGRFLTPDPLAEKYYSVSPYAFCSGNPVNFVDWDGRDFRRKIRRETIYITASYYTDTKSKKSAQMAVSFWNNRTGDTYTDESGQKYKVVYDLQVYEVNMKDKAKYENANIYIVDDGLVTKPVAAGETWSDKHIYVRQGYSIYKPGTKDYSSTGAHEVGHTLGMDHKNNGIMSPMQDEDRTYDVPQENINEMMKSVSGSNDKLSSFFLWINKLLNSQPNNGN